MSQRIEREIIAHLSKLPPEQQRQVLSYVSGLAAAGRSGVPGEGLLGFTGAIEANDLDAMTRAIEEGCERVNSDEW